MSEAKKDQLLDWLRDAHAMEIQAEKMLQGQASRIENYPQLKARIEQHIDETRSQAKLLEECIERLGGSTSTMKDLGGKVTAMGQSIGGMMMGDEVVKGALSGYTFEHMEIASYKILIAAAESAGELHVKQVCEQILQEEIAMAQWLSDHLAEVTQQYMAKEAAPGVSAKR